MKRLAILAVLLLTGCLAVPQPSAHTPTAEPTAAPTLAPTQDFGELQQIAGVTSVVGGDWPHVTVGSADDLASVQAALADHPLWQDGGILWAEEGRVRLTELPDSLTPAGYELIIATSVAYPGAQFWLEAPTTGHGWPQLFVDQVSVEEAPAVAAALGTPTNAAAFDVNYFIRAIGPDGPVDSTGVLGKS